MMKRYLSALCHFCFLFFSMACGTAGGSQELAALKIDHPIQIGGENLDPAWDQSQGIKTRDPVAEIEISLKALYTDTHIYFLIRYPDKDESRLHKPWVWDPQEKMYVIGPDREDTFVFKWNLNPQNVDLRLKGRKDHRCDIWLWKANRTDPSNAADDKIDTYSSKKLENAQILQVGSRTMYLLRQEDAGRSAYEEVVPKGFEGEKMACFRARTPTGSRGDISAKGRWKDGFWLIEVGRKLVTGNEDDISFSNLEKRYLFGVSRFEIAGRKADPSLSQPLYGTGDVGEDLFLVFQRK